jgi:hypothetical protein
VKTLDVESGVVDTKCMKQSPTAEQREVILIESTIPPEMTIAEWRLTHYLRRRRFRYLRRMIGA